MTRYIALFVIMIIFVSVFWINGGYEQALGASVIFLFYALIRITVLNYEHLERRFSTGQLFFLSLYTLVITAVTILPFYTKHVYDMQTEVALCSLSVVFVLFFFGLGAWRYWDNVGTEHPKPIFSESKKHS